MTYRTLENLSSPSFQGSSTPDLFHCLTMVSDPPRPTASATPPEGPRDSGGEGGGVG